MAPNVCRKTQEDLFLEVTSKPGLHDLCGRNFLGKSCASLFGEIQAKLFASPNICLLLHLWP